MLWKLGRWLILRNYVKCHTEDERQATVIHDLRLQVQELHNKNSRLRLERIIRILA